VPKHPQGLGKLGDRPPLFELNNTGGIGIGCSRRGDVAVIERFRRGPSRQEFQHGLGYVIHDLPGTSRSTDENHSSARVHCNHRCHSRLRAFAAGRGVRGHPPSVGREKFVIASLRINPPVVIHAPNAKNLLATGEPVVLAGDYNVMPTDLDVYAPERWVDDALFRPRPAVSFNSR
jgi:hypothetical protein